MNAEENPIARHERIAARASALHDVAFADPKIDPKPSWEQSLAAAERSGDAPPTTIPQTHTKRPAKP